MFIKEWLRSDLDHLNGLHITWFSSSKCPYSPLWKQNLADRHSPPLNHRSSHREKSCYARQWTMHQIQTRSATQMSSAKIKQNMGIRHHRRKRSSWPSREQLALMALELDLVHKADKESLLLSWSRGKSAESVVSTHSKLDCLHCLNLAVPASTNKTNRQN